MLKRLFDLVVSLVLLILLSPLLFILYVLSLINIGRPILFSQVRPGKGGKSFKMYKFRTMKNIYDENGELLPDNQRMTKYGKFLRSTSLDELPELFNILKGDMSFVGPRPLLVEYLPLYSKEQSRRHNVKPGLTGWAQINGRNSISWEEKFSLDIWYVDNRSFILDLKIMFLTFLKVIKRDGISQEGNVTMEKFNGSN